MSTFITLIFILCEVLSWAIIIRVILSWFNIRPDNPFWMFLYHVTEPVLAPLRRIIPRLGMFDITPLVAIIILLYLIPLLLNVLE